MRLNAKQVALYTGGTFIVAPIDPSALLYGLSWDSRDIEPHWLYVALPGERVDGHSFVAQALRAGAGAALVHDPIDQATQTLARELGAAIIEVAHTPSALCDLAREWRSHLKGRVIGLTGSTGKTTTKNLVRDVAAAGFSVVATQANQNNELGVPKTLLNANPETEVIVVEMGMRGRGQIDELCNIVRPDWGLVTNVGESHIELLGSRENIAHAKAELLCNLPEGRGVAFINDDDDATHLLLEDAASATHPLVLTTFGTHKPVESLESFDETYEPPVAVWAQDIELDEEGRAQFVICAQRGAHAGDEIPPLESAPCKLVLRGRHNVSNACAAAAVGVRLGLSLDVIAHALGASIPESGRQEVLRARGGFTIINDAYNANPDSMRASLATFAALSVAGKRIAVLGDMGELGDFAVACHRGVGRACARSSLDMLICVGDLAAHIAEEARAQGMNDNCVIQAQTVADVIEILDGILEPQDAVLVKASHFMGLERVVEGLVN